MSNGLLQKAKDIARPENGLGRIPHFDPRSMRYRMGDYLQGRVAVLPDEKVWQRGQTLNQGSEGACVGFGWVAWENCKPLGYIRQQGNDYAFDWYHRAQLLDPFPGTNYSGTTVGAGGKVAKERGLAASYVWASTYDDISAFVRSTGPVVMGTTWLRSMDRVGPDNYLTVDFSSGARGGHCWLLYGFLRDGTAVCQNSWGDGYADGGTFFLHPRGLKQLLYHNGEGAACIQTGVPAR
jgi:hypothetical protein